MPTAGEDAETPADRAAAIRAFYELHPYPAPAASLERRLDRYADPRRRRAQSLLLWPLEKHRPDRKIFDRWMRNVASRPACADGA